MTTETTESEQESRTADAAVEKEETKPPIPEVIDLNVFQTKSLAELYQIAQEFNLRVGANRTKHQLVFEILTFFGRRGSRIEAEGILEVTKDNVGFVRWPIYNFAPTPDSVYIQPAVLRKSSLQCGNLVRVVVRAPRDREKYLTMEEVLEVEGKPYEDWQEPVPFDKLTPLFPQERIILENPDSPHISGRVVDIISPLGKGQRGIIVAPPRGGKTILLKDVAASISRNHPEIELIVLLLDERPEEVTDFRETVDAPVYSSTFDETSLRHVQVAEVVSERAKRLVEQGKDVVILLDSITRLARGYNGLVGGGKNSRFGTGGLNIKALTKPKKFFGAARNVEDGGSLTILATALVETESRMDDAIFEEFKGTGNMEIQLDRELAERRVWPAIHVQHSGTRKDDLLYHPQELPRINLVRKQLAQLPAVEAIEVLIQNLKRTKSNAELLLQGIRS